MQKLQGNAKTKALMVIEGLTGKPVAESCHEPQSSPLPYDQRRDQFFRQCRQRL